MYLLRGVKIDRANQVFALDTTYIPMVRSFVYLTAVGRIPVSRGCRLGAERSFCPLGLPDIVNTDQGSQFTAGAFTGAVLG
ncbi:hypothetical protein [Paraburkholderia atlantica]|uniref:hypothetical protein n=1 Tax=Paraburkholderia atlantica TaxID=2654982 RepID=UPI0001BF1371|nr:hypothetical protein [Paraburkholderia atlantica]